MRQSLKSKTIKWNMIMAALQVLNANMMMMESLFAPEVYVIIATGIAIAHSVGGVYLRHITDKSIDEL